MHMHPIYHIVWYGLSNIYPYILVYSTLQRAIRSTTHLLQSMTIYFRTTPPTQIHLCEFESHLTINSIYRYLLCQIHTHTRTFVWCKSIKHWIRRWRNLIEFFYCWEHFLGGHFTFRLLPSNRSVLVCNQSEFRCNLHIVPIEQTEKRHQQLGINQKIYFVGLVKCFHFIILQSWYDGNCWGNAMT